MIFEHSKGKKSTDMNHKEIVRKYNSIVQAILNGKIGIAIKNINELIENINQPSYQNKLETITNTYENILKFSFSDIEDPKRDEIYNHVQRSLINLTDSIKEDALISNSGYNIYKQKWSFIHKNTYNSETILDLLDQLTKDNELRQLITQDSSDQSDKQISREVALEQIFNFIWFSDEYKEKENRLMDTICQDEIIPWHDKAIFVSSLIMSTIQQFNKNKVLKLIDFINKREHHVWQRAFVGLVIIIYIYDSRMELYPDIMDKIKLLSDEDDYITNIEAITIQLLKSKETEKITKKWEEEILPEMLKMQSEIEKKLDIENIVKDKFLEDKNPDWETVFSDSPDLLDKLQEFSQMQIEGSDVFMSAFAKLKHFNFFNPFHNWFTPFYKENPEIEQVLQEQSIDFSSFVEKLEGSQYMCNSDKYSFLMNLQHIPEMHKKKMIELFNAEVEGMTELSQEDELLNHFSSSKKIITQFIQDLYRFLKLHPYKKEFTDIFNTDLDIHNTILFKDEKQMKESLKLISEFALSKDNYSIVLDILLKEERKGNSSGEVFEKIGYSYQRLGNYEKALEYYKKAEILDTNKLWILKKIALCHRYLNNHKEALDYYKEAEKLDPENLYIQAYIGHSLLSLKEYEEALKYYFKVEYLSPSNQKIQRPIAWISLIIGKFDTAEKYYKKLIDSDKNRLDYISLGHVHTCQNKMKEAMKYYKKAYNLFDYNYKLFVQDFLEDRNILLDHGVDDATINLVIDYLLFFEK